MPKMGKISSDAVVILTLRKKQPLTPQEIIKETELSTSSAYRALDRLGRVGAVKVVKEKTIGKEYALQDFSSEEGEILRFLDDWKSKHRDIPPPIDEIMISVNKDPEDVEARKKVRSILAKHGCNPSSPVPYEDRRRHTQDLMEVIKEMKELPSVSDFDVDVVEVKHGVRILGLGPPSYEGQELAFERHTLFSDLHNHLEPDMFETWSEFKEETKRFRGIRGDLTDNIEKMLRKKLDVVGVHDGRGELKCGFITPSLTEFILKVAYALLSERGHRMLTDYFVTGLQESKLEDGCLIRSAGTSVFRISHREDVEKTKKKMKHVVEEVREKYSSELESLRSSLSTLEGYRGKIIRILERHLYMPILDGYCEYLILPPRRGETTPFSETP